MARQDKDLDKDIDDMIEEIKKPTKNIVYIFENDGKNIYRREFGADISTREKIEENKDD